MSDSEILAAVGMMYFVEIAQPGAANSESTAVPVGAPIADLPLWSSRRPEQHASRWTLDAWSLARGGQAQSAFAPQLGGAQAGVRLGYFLDDAHRSSAFVRATTPLAKPGVELAAGLQWQPGRAPVAIFAEARRRAGGSVVPVAGIVGGAYQVPVTGHWRLDGYGQAGVVGARHVEGFAEGQMRIVREVGTVGPATIDAGGGAWGGVQRGARRFDLGPSLGLAVPARTGNFRLSLDWRQRVAGNAVPASGPVLTLSAGF